MTSVMLILMMQFVISTKAGLVNYVQGTANVRATQSVAKGVPIKTGPEGFAEVLLNPGSFLRMGPNSEAVLEGTDLLEVSIRIVSGTAVIEAAGFTKETPLNITSGDLKFRIIKDGIFAVEEGQVKVAEGQLLVDTNKNVYKKGWVVSKTGALKFSKTHLLEVEVWSRNRSNLIQVANTNMGYAIGRNPSLASSFNNVWLWDPSFGAFTFMPGSRYRSPYGYSYRNVQETYYPRGDSSSSRGGNTAWGGGGGGASSPSSSTSGGGGGSSSAVSPAAAAPRPEPSTANDASGAAQRGQRSRQ